MTISPLRTGLAFGGLLGVFHLLWAAIVALGVAQSLIDFVLRIHFIEISARIAPFSAGLAAILVLTTTTIGFALGYAFASIWNWLHSASIRPRGSATAAS